jgi:hypothetical protein
VSVMHEFELRSHHGQRLGLNVVRARSRGVRPGRRMFELAEFVAESIAYGGRLLGLQGKGLPV